MSATVPVAAGHAEAVRPGLSAAPATAPWSSSLALWTLVVLAVVSPWPFGSVEPWAVRTLTIAALGACAVVIGLQIRSGGLLVPSGRAVSPLLALAGLALFQLVPLPSALHRWIAPGSHRIWHPAGAAPAAVLGDAFRPLSIHPAASADWLAFTAGLVLLGVLALPAAGAPGVLIRAASTLVASGVAVAVYGIVAHVLFGSLLYGSMAVPTVAPFGPFVSKNHFAGYVEMAAIVALGLALGLARTTGGEGALDWVRSTRSWQPLLAFIAFAAIVLGILVSLSRGGLLGLLAGVVVFFAIRLRVGHRRLDWRSVLPAAAAATMIGALLLLLPGETHERIGSLATLGAERSAPFRVQVWRDALRASGASPLLGYGSGTFADALPSFKSGSGELRVEHAENEYVEVLVEMGGLGLALVAAAVFAGSREALRGYRAHKHRLLRRLGPGCLAAVAALLVHDLFDFNLRIPSNAVLFASVAALAMGAALAPPARRGPVASIALGLLVASLLAWAVWPESPAPRVYDEARRVASSREPTSRGLRAVRTEEELRRLIRTRPAAPEPWLLLGWLRLARGDREQAASLARHALELDPQGVDVIAAAASLAAP